MEQPIHHRIVAWNPNGIRALCDKNGKEIKRLITEYDPHVVIWNETKGNSKKQDEMTKKLKENMPGYSFIWHNSQTAGRHGTCLAHKGIEIISTDLNLYGNPENEGRIITIETKKCFIVGLYVVNAGMENCSRLKYKLEWMAKLTLHLEALKKKDPTKMVIAMGDWNIAPTEKDIHNAKSNEKSAGYTKEERDCFSWLMKRGWIDVYRLKHPDERKYTFWNAKSNARSRGAGWRIDHVIVNQSAEQLLGTANCEILDGFMGSDHCPIYFDIEL